MPAILILAFLFCNSACQKNPSKEKKYALTSEEHKSLEKFFRCFMLDESAIFTLLGSKPLTEVIVDYYKEDGSSPSPEEMKGFYITLNRDDPADMALYKTVPKECTVKLVRDADYIGNIGKLWDFWEQISSRFPISKKFLLVKTERPPEDVAIFESCEKMYDILFVDVFETASVLQENYDLFKRAVGFDFDPLKITLEIGKPGSSFWTSINSPKYSYLWGLLYGFGKENSFSYYWKYRLFWSDMTPETQAEKAFAESIKKQPFRFAQDFFMKCSIDDFPIPAFATYSKPNSMVMQYEKEREEIQKLYKGKDFVDYTLELLTEGH